jgi:MerR family transcriptional regulator, light-induced transcriptional regulator
MELGQIYDGYVAALQAGDRRRALRVAQAALDDGIDIRDLYLDVFQPAMHEVGRLWESNQFTVAQEHLATAITQSVMAQIYARIFTSPTQGRKVIATCIGGELHELGIRMVADFFEIEGYDVYYLGANMPVPDVVRMINDRRADILAISVTLGSHLPQARSLIQAVRASPQGGHVKIMVGGQPFNRTPDAYQAIGADFTAKNAREAVARAAEVLV